MIYKKGRYYMVKFMWQGRMIRKSTRCANAKDARTVEGKIRSELGKGNWGILEATPAPTLAEFLNRDFLPYSESKFKEKPGSFQYYRDGVKRLLASEIAKLTLDSINDQHARQFEARWSALSPSTVNCGLRTLRRALSLATEWGKLDRMPRIRLASGERQRDRVLSRVEAGKYLAACPQPWRDGATLILGTGMRPGEVYKLRWEHVLLSGHGGLIQIVAGKTKAARRLLPMLPEVFQVLKDRHASQGFPAEGWVFPTGSLSGHMEESSAKKWHAKALEESKVKPFEPYCLKHTALTWLAEDTGGDVFALARIAGHTSIAITQRYIHPQARAVERIFERASRRELVTDGGHRENLMLESLNASEVLTGSKTEG
jgi:integrase